MHSGFLVRCRIAQRTLPRFTIATSLPDISIYNDNHADNGRNNVSLIIRTPFLLLHVDKCT